MLLFALNMRAHEPVTVRFVDGPTVIVSAFIKHGVESL